MSTRIRPPGAFLEARITHAHACLYRTESSCELDTPVLSPKVYHPKRNETETHTNRNRKDGCGEGRGWTMCSWEWNKRDSGTHNEAEVHDKREEPF